MNILRAKIRVGVIQDNGTTATEKTFESISAHGVYSEDPSSENKSFAKATPSLTLTMQIDNPKAFGFWEEGAEYYLDITRAEKSES
ncbi:MAG TPA: hypothetical protein VF599_12640 [Pyrinomonadaceae bacterium]|jgi:hypothetical protein